MKAATSLCKSIGREAAPMFFWGGKAAKAKAEDRRSLDPDGWLARFVRSHG
jgi:hypothetical protein